MSADSANGLVLTCGCKGIRSCLICENQEGLRNVDRKLKIQRSKGDRTSEEFEEADVYIFCHICCLAFKDDEINQHPDHSPDFYENFSGIFIKTEFVTPKEEEQIVQEMEKSEWAESQSGRRKQDFGPKVNFKKKRLKLDVFTGLPDYSRSIYERMKTLNNLSDFLPVELCNLDYDPLKGAAIDHHFDDFWLWGERLVTVNFLSDTILSMTNEQFPNVEILVPMPRRSVIIVSGDARFKWKHGIHRKHITSRRIAMTWRELTSEFLAGGKQEAVGKGLIDIALKFEGMTVQNFILNKNLI